MSSLAKNAAQKAAGGSVLRRAGDASHDPADSGPIAEPPAAPTTAEPAETEAPAAAASAPAKVARPRAAKRANPAAAKAAPAAEATPAASQAVEPVVLTPTTRDAERIGLYIHPDDYRALYTAKLDDRADANARIRAMIALWRANPRFRANVDRLARTAPRGPYSGKK